MNKQRGFTLVEMLTSISTGSVLLVLAMSMVQNTMRAASTARVHAQTERTAARLSRQFRRDVHQARSISLENEQADVSQLRLVLPGQRPVTYRVENSSLLREQQVDDEKTHRETYAFPNKHSIRFEQLSEPSRVVMTVQFDTGLVGVEPPVRLHVEAVIGQLLRLQRTTENVQ